MALKDISNIILKKCMALKRNESCLIVCDKNKIEIGNSLFEAAQLLTDKDAELLEIPVGKENGEEQPAEVREIMKKFNVIIIATTKSVTHTMARKEACAAGARIASMPGITEEMMLRAIDIDYNKMQKLNTKILKILENADEVVLTTEKGTDLKLSLKGRKCQDDNGMNHKKGDFSNIPAGEVYVAPLEGTANGAYIIDASVGSAGKVDKDIKVTVKDGFAVKIEGGKSAELFVKSLKSVKDRNAFNVAELGIGTNENARICGKVLEDEKVIGTAHIALGNSYSFGGAVKVPIHLDGVFYNPTIIVDGKKMMEKGKFLI